MHALVDECPLLHVAFGGATGDDPTEPVFPTILPMLGCTGVWPAPSRGPNPGEPRDVYLHGYVSSRLFRTAKTSTPDATRDDGLPVCVGATFLDGIVLALTPNHHSCNYRSAVIYGHAFFVEDDQERLYAMELITNNLVAGRWERTRYPNAAEFKATGIIRVRISSASAKVRVGQTGEDRKDLQNEDMRKQVWAGVMPVHMVYGELVAAPHNLYSGTPNYLEDERVKKTEAAKEYAVKAAQ